MTPKLNRTIIEKVAQRLPGKKKEKLLWAAEKVHQCLKEGAWQPGGSRSARASMTGGFISTHIYVKNSWKSETGELAQQLSYLLCSGSTQTTDTLQTATLQEITPAWEHCKTWNDRPLDRVKLTPREIMECIKVVFMMHNAMNFLDSRRPKTEYHTVTLLSPKVTKTLKETNLDLDIQSVKMPELKEMRINYKNEKGEDKVYIWYKTIWPEGIQHRQSRFAGSPEHCEACGKHIPSRRFVPIQAKDKKGKRLVSLWLGVDCARSIFGVKDIGVDRIKPTAEELTRRKK